MDELKAYNKKELESLVRSFWEKEQIPQGIEKARLGKKRFFLLDGPPYTNNQAHVGHVKTTTMKDIWSRYYMSLGYNPWYQPGFDCHGLPTEVMVEKELGIVDKSEIETKFGIETFDKKCLEKAQNTEKAWIDYYKQLGAWRGYYKPYFTFEAGYIESGWWAFKKIHENGLLVQGDKSIHWCARCETSLSGYEVSDSYKDLPSPSIYVKFKVKGTKNEYLLVWTTTPWTLPANVAVAVHPDEEYVKAEHNAETLILAKKRLEALEAELKVKFKVKSSLKGSELDGVEYEPLLSDMESQKSIKGAKAHRVYMSLKLIANKKYTKKLGAVGNQQAEEVAEFVTMDSGSGMVHTAPGHGQTDNLFGKHYGLPVLNPVDEKGKFDETVTGFTGKFVLKANKLIIEKLDSEGKLLYHSDFTHRAAVCWRCKTPLIFRSCPQWYLKVDPIKEKILKENENVNWMPDFGGSKFHNWIADREDWCLSQQRYWGIPMPIWKCTKCSDLTFIGSRKELIEKSKDKLSMKDLDDLHRHTVDKITLKCSTCNGDSRRIRDIFTVWYDSGIAPWASLHYPFENKDVFESMFPMDIIVESQDQIRGWFDSLMLCSMATFGKAPYKSVGLMGWLLDEKGEKMSKSLGNVTWAAEGIDKLGADSIRLYYCSEIAPWETQKFSLQQATRLTGSLTTLWNVHTFLKTYGQNHKLVEPSKTKLNPEDAWVISRLNSTAQLYHEKMKVFAFHEAGRALNEFILNDFSRMYVKLVRDRLGDADQACENTIRYCLINVVKLLAPMCPFVSEYLYQQLKSSCHETAKSVHFALTMEPQPALINAELEEMFNVTNEVSEAVNSARQEAKIKLRWPVANVYLVGAHQATVDTLKPILCSLTNSENVEYKTNEPKGSFVTRELKGYKVLLDTHRSKELKDKATYREVTRAVQALRKEQKLVVSDVIELTLDASEATAKMLKSHEKELKADVGAKVVKFVKLDDKATTLELEEDKVKLQVTKV